MTFRATYAPWTDWEVRKLNEFQTCGHVHPFTCGTKEKHGFLDKEVLVAHNTGWYCPTCDYTQDWAHAFMLRGAPPHPAEGQ